MIDHSVFTNLITKKIERIHNRQYRIRIYGNTLGRLDNMIDFLKALEKNYLSILSYQKIMQEIVFNKEGDLPFKMVGVRPDYHWQNVELGINGQFKQFDYDKRRKFLEFQFLYDVNNIVLPEESPLISKISYNSPGFWEVIASWSPFEQIRMYINERHDRVKDKTYAWELDKAMKEVEIETMRLNNDLIRLDIIDKVSVQLKEMGLSDIEIRHSIQKYYGNLNLLDQHIDSERIIDIKRVDDDGNEIMGTEIEFID